jgi:hypothetical protein
MKWKMQIKFILPELGIAYYAIRCMKHYSNSGTFKVICYTYFHPVVTYGVIFCGNLMDSNKVFPLQKEIVTILVEINPTSTCRPVSKNLRILTVASQYICSLMKILVNNLEYFIFNNIIHIKFTRNRIRLHVPQTN